MTMTKALVIPVMFLALVVRLGQMRGANLWFDEAIEFNVANRPIREVIAADRASTHDPPLFSLVLNLWNFDGRTDYYLRILPVSLSLLAVAVTFALGQLAYSPGVGWLGALLVAVAPRAVFYGQEVNQYAMVLLFAVLCPLLLERYLRRPSTRRLLRFIFAGAAAILTHYQLALYVFALALIATFGLLRHAPKGDRRQLILWIAGLTMLGLVGIGLLWSYALPQKARLPPEFAPARYSSPLAVGAEIKGWVYQSVEIIGFLFWGFEPTPLRWLAVGLLLWGGHVSLWIPQSRRLPLYLLTGLVVAYCAAGLGFFLYAHRYLWFAFPLSVLLVSAGILSPTLFGQRGFFRVGASGVIAIGFVSLLIARLPLVSGKPFTETEQLGEVVRYVEEHRQPGDTVYVYYGATPAFRVYAGDQLSALAVVEGWARNVSPEQRRANLWAVVGEKPRAWILMSHVNADDEAVWLSLLNAKCRPTDAIRTVHAVGYLFDCSA